MFVDVGFSNYVSVEKIITISRPDSAPIKRMMDEAKNNNRFINLTQGKKTRSIIVSSKDNNIVVIGAAVQPSTIVSRIRKIEEEKLARNASELIENSGLEVIAEGSSE